METTEDENIRRWTAILLSEMGQKNLEAIAALVKIIENTTNEKTAQRIANILNQIDPGNSKGIALGINSPQQHF